MHLQRKWYAKKQDGLLSFGVRMKSMTMSTIIIIVLAILMLVIYLGITNIFKNSTESITNDWTKYTTKYEQDNYLNNLENSYNSYAEDGFDSYEASALIGEAIEYAWKICYKRCKSETALFSNFFVDHPIKIAKQLDCTDASKTQADLSIIKDDYCNAKSIGTDKTKVVDEWTTTIWGLLAQNRLCGSETKEGEWGNSDCGSSDDDISKGKKCYDRCKGTPEKDDRIKWKGKMEMGKDYTVEIMYNPDDSILPLKGKPVIKVKIHEFKTTG